MFKKSFLSLITLTTCYVTVLTEKTNVDYCKLNCTDKVHTFCKYKTNEFSSECTDVVRSGLDDSEKQLIVNFHNKLRQNVARGNEKRGNPGPQPAAKNMANLEWDEELALIAQRWANQCDYNHDCSKVERFDVGQNAVEIENSENDTDIKELMQEWYDEVDSYNGQSVSSFVNSQNEDGQDIGHYTQMLWAKTSKIGCGFVLYKRDDNFVNYLVCNYGESGNVKNKPVYQTK